MIDIHSHIIHGVDDGPSCINQALKMVKEAERLGISYIMASPHYHESIYDLDRVEENYQELLFKAQDYDVKISMGYEVFANPNESGLLKNRKKLGINKSNLQLIEFPFNGDPQKCIDLVYQYRAQKIVPIIAHVERNRAFLNKTEYLVAFIKAGCYIQVDAASITGIYGQRIKEFTKKLLQMKVVDMVASNAHCAADYTERYTRAFANVTHWVGKEEAKLLFHDNAKNILEYDRIRASDFAYKRMYGLKGS